MSDIKLDARDVTIRPIEREHCDCGALATRAVWLDMRNNGIARAVITAACAACAREHAALLRASMPKRGDSG